jgi:flagellar protein FlaG
LEIIMDIRSVSPSAMPAPQPGEREAATARAAAPAGNPPAAVAVPPQATSAPRQPGEPDALDAAIGHINKSLQASGQGVEFSIDDDSKRLVVKVVDQETREVLRQMPSAEALAIAKALDRSQGMLIRQEA